MTRDEPNGEVNLEAMLPELRAGLRLSAERRAGQAFPGLRLWKVILGGVLLVGISLWFVAELPLLRTFGCAGVVLALGAWLSLGWWWSIQVKRRMREVLLDPRRCLRCGYPLVGLEGPNCPECGEPFIRDSG